MLFVTITKKNLHFFHPWHGLEVRKEGFDENKLGTTVLEG